MAQLAKNFKLLLEKHKSHKSPFRNVPLSKLKDVWDKDFYKKKNKYVEVTPKIPTLVHEQETMDERILHPAEYEWRRYHGDPYSLNFRNKNHTLKTGDTFGIRAAHSNKYVQRIILPHTGQNRVMTIPNEHAEILRQHSKAFPEMQHAVSENLAEGRGRPKKSGAAPSDEEGNDKHIIVQMHKALSVHKPVDFQSGERVTIEPSQARKALSHYFGLRKPDEKENWIQRASAGLKSFRAAIGENLNEAAVKTMRSHTDYARFLAASPEAGFISDHHVRHIPSPYRSGPVSAVYEHNGKPVVVKETRHRRYEVHPVPEGAKIHSKMEDAEQEFGDWIHNKSKAEKA